MVWERRLATDKRMSLLYGVLLGDGCLSKCLSNGKHYYFVVISGHAIDDRLFFYDMIDLLQKITGRLYRIKKQKGNGMEINFTNKALFTLLKSLEFPVGRKGPKLKIPLFFDYDAYRNIVRGYFATDGSLVLTNNNGILYPRIEFSSISKGLLEQVLIYLESFGMKGNIYVSKRYINPNYYDLHRIQCNGRKNLEIFRSKIGFTNPKHEIKYQKYKNKVPVARFELATATLPG
jgi:hypothetical protein